MEFTTVNMESEGGGVMTDEYVIILRFTLSFKHGSEKMKLCAFYLHDILPLILNLL